MTTNNSLTAMIAAVTYEIGQRSDLQANGTVLRYIQNAIEIYQKERFRFNELVPLTPFTLNTVQGQSVYTAVDDARIPLLMQIDYINYLLGNTTERMDRVMPETVYLALQNGQQAGPPQEWAWDGQSIVIYPAPPAQVYQLTIGGYVSVAGPDPSTPAGLANTTNPWMNDAEMLIRSRAKYEIALHVTRNKDLIALMSPSTPGGAAYDAYCMLKSEASKIRATSRVRPMAF